MNRRLLWRTFANVATGLNGLSGIWAIIYILWGNKLFALALIFTGIGWDGLDGYAARRSGSLGGVAGRVADSAADTITFCLAPAALIAFDDYPTATWAPFGSLLWITAILVSGLGIARLIYFTLKAHSLPYFLGASTPQNALAISFLVLLLDVPGYVGIDPLALIALAILLSLIMVLPVKYPKMREKRVWRWFFLPMMVTGVFAMAIPNFRPEALSPLYLGAYASALAGLVLLLTFYVVGPFMVKGEPTHGEAKKGQAGA